MMASAEQHRISISLRAVAVGLAIMLMVVATQVIEAQTFTVIHSFTGGQDGGYPEAGLTVDRVGNLYGTTYLGVIFKMSRKGSSWVFNPLGRVGSNWAGVALGVDGSLFGTTPYGGGTGCAGQGCGTVYDLKPPPHSSANILGGWVGAVLYSFSGGSDGAKPGYGGVVFDDRGNLYGTTTEGGVRRRGTVYELRPSNGGWTEQVLYFFSGPDGATPYSALTFDQAGHLYGTTADGGPGFSGGGLVFELIRSESGWSETILHSFPGSAPEGQHPYGAVVFDTLGNLYGTTSAGGSDDGGTVFELTPNPDGSWTSMVLYDIPGDAAGAPSTTCTLAIDAAGALYGTTFYGGPYGYGSVIKLTPSSGGWTEIDLYDFTGGSDGAGPYGVTLDANGNIYGTAGGGGLYGYGVVFEITP